MTLYEFLINVCATVDILSFYSDPCVLYCLYLLSNIYCALHAPIIICVDLMGQMQCCSAVVLQSSIE